MANYRYDTQTRAEVAVKLRALREEHWLTRQQLALKAGVSAETIKNWERGDVMPKLENMIVLARVYGMDTRELFGETVIDTAQRLASEMPATGQRSRAVMAKAIAEELASRKMSPEQAAYVRANPQVIAASPIRETLEKQAGVEAQPRIFPKLKPEYAPKQEEPAHEEPKAIITMIPRGENVLDFQKFISRKLVEAARKSSDETVRKLADVLALIDEYEGERRCEGNQSTAA